MCDGFSFNESFGMYLTPYGWPEPDDDYDYELDDVDPDDYNFDPECPLNNPTGEYDH